MLVAAVQSMAWGRARGAHAACTGRSIEQNSISGSLPTEIGKLSRLATLYGFFSLPGLWRIWEALAHQCSLWHLVLKSE